MKKSFVSLILLVVFWSAVAPLGYAQEGAEEAKAPTAESNAEKVGAVEGDVSAFKGDVDALWTCLAAFLVFFMQAGFAMVESGFTRAKNSVNLLMKNLMDFSIGSILFWVVGFGLMFGASEGYFGTTDFMKSGIRSEGGTDSWFYAFWLFQAVFCATAATIVSGGVAERTKFVGYIIYSMIICAVIYPVFGSWCWNGLWQTAEDAPKGWLEQMGFIDFAGSTVVHSVGGWAALAGTIALGPRIGKYGEDGSIRALPGHSMPLAALGVFILWLGWFGFNPGSTTAVGGSGFAIIAVTTNLAAAAGAIMAMITSWILSPVRKPDLSMSLNGALAGLVAITCPCATVTPAGAIAIGAIGGVLVYLSVIFFDRMRVDDPVGAISVHGVCGAWGTLAAGLFGAEGVLDPTATSTGLFYGGGAKQLGIQATGVLACFVWVMATCLVLFYGLKFVGLLRVPPEEEKEGLDRVEHGASAYHFTEPA